MKEFNTTGLCIPKKHYMCDTAAKFARCKELIEGGKYFAINFPRQFGKTTMQFLLQEEFKKDNDYLVLSISFEGIGDKVFESEDKLAPMVIELFAEALEYSNPEISLFLEENIEKVKDFKKLGKFISHWIKDINKKLILIIDEVDKASNNQTFISFLGLLRDRYLQAPTKGYSTFHSVALIGVHDVKSLKLKLRDDSATTLNSPWNISENLNTTFAFSAKEIEPMLADYAEERNIQMPIAEIADRIYYYTSGNPFLVSMFCKIIDEKLIEKNDINWTVDDIENAYLYLVHGTYSTTNFDDLSKNLENNDELFNVVKNIVLDGKIYKFNMSNPVISKGSTFGILSANQNGICDVSNKVYEFRIFDYMLSKEQTREDELNLYLSRDFKKDGKLNVVLILEAFQLFMKENHSSKDNDFLEKNGRLLLMSFLRPIVNGHGFMFKENVSAEDRKMDLVIVFNNKRYIIELKIWRGEKYLADGIEQLCDYLDHYNLDSGCMLIYNFNKNKKYETIKVKDCKKYITAIFV